MSWNVVYWSVPHLILNSVWIRYSLRLWAETYIGLTLKFLSVSSTPSSLISPSDESIQLETLGEEFGLLKAFDGENILHFEFWTAGCIGIVKTMAILTREFVWWDALVLWGQYLHHPHHDIQIIQLILGYVFYRLLKRLCYIVDWLLQWSRKTTTRTGVDATANVATCFQSGHYGTMKITPFSAKIFALFLDGAQVWPSTTIDAKACKLLHELNWGWK